MASGGGAATLEDLIALNDEIRALVRAGLPLERGLLGAGGELGGRLGAISTALGEHLARGEGLESAIAAEKDRLPPVYRAVVTAGIRSGRLATALESVASYVRNYAELRRVIGLAMIYPLLVVLSGYALFLALLLFLVPRFLSAFQDLHLPGMRLLLWLDWLGRHVAYWGWIVPALLAILALLWVATGKAGAFPARHGGWAIRCIPWLRRLLLESSCASFAELLALLVEQGVPFPEALELAASSTGEPSIERIATRLADQARRGERLQPLADGGRTDLGMLAWLIVNGHQQGSLVPALHYAAETYQRRVVERAEVIRTVLPLAAVVLVGAGATLIYALLLFLPLSTMLNQLSDNF